MQNRKLHISVRNNGVTVVSWWLLTFIGTGRMGVNSGTGAVQMFQLVVEEVFRQLIDLQVSTENCGVILLPVYRKNAVSRVQWIQSFKKSLKSSKTGLKKGMILGKRSLIYTNV